MFEVIIQGSKAKIETKSLILRKSSMEVRKISNSTVSGDKNVTFYRLLPFENY